MKNAKNHYPRFSSKDNHVPIDTVKTELRLSHVFAAMPDLRQAREHLERIENLALNTQSDPLTLAFPDVVSN
jgi:hypothetical protein